MFFALFFFLLKLKITLFLYQFILRSLSLRSASLPILRSTPLLSPSAPRGHRLRTASLVSLCDCRLSSAPSLATSLHAVRHTAPKSTSASFRSPGYARLRYVSRRTLRHCRSLHCHRRCLPTDSSLKQFLVYQ